MNNSFLGKSGKVLLLSAHCLLLAAPVAMAQSFSLIDTVSNTVGTTAEIGLSSSGTKDNTAVWSAGVVGQFMVQDKEGGIYGLRVEALNPTGVLSAGTDSLMVARTVSSQGLTDTGTLSVYVSPGNTTPVSGAWTLDLRFTFYDATFTSTVPVELLLTSLDIDYDQRYYVSNTDFSANHLYGGSTLRAAPAVAGYTGFTSPTSSNYNNPANAVSSDGTGSQFQVRLGHDAVALYMFEFRNPSQIVPEPGVALLAALGAFGVLRRRRQA